MPAPDLRATIEELAQRIAGVDYISAEQRLADIYRMAQLLILDKIGELVARRSDRLPDQLQAMLAEVTRRYRQAVAASQRWVNLQSKAAFDAGRKVAARQLEMQGISRISTTFTQVHREAVAAVARDSMHDILAATQRTEERVKDGVRAVVQRESLSMSATGIRGIDGAKRITEQLAEENIFGITAKNGRFMPMDEYARCVAHVKQREAHTAGTEAMIQDNGMDLVRVSTHLHVPDSCSPLEGKVYSLTGKTPGYPPLVRHTPFHIGCKHVETPFVETFRSDAEIERIRAESNRPGQITVYPKADMDALLDLNKKRSRFLRVKRDLRKRDAADVAAGVKQPPADMAAYGRSLTARANAKIRKLDNLRSLSGPGRGYKDLPGPEQVGTVSVPAGQRSVEIRGAWLGKREKQTVEEALSTLNPRFLDKLSHIEFENESGAKSGKRRRGNYNLDSRVITLYRDSDRNWASKNEGQLQKSRHTVLHETAHHVYNVTMSHEWRREWEKVAGLTGRESVREVQEKFAQQFAEAIVESGNVSEPVAAFFRRFRNAD